MSSVLCSYFVRGLCRFGNRCWNSHDLGSARSYSPYQQQTTDDGEVYPRSVSVSTQTVTPSTSASTTKHNPPAASGQKSHPEPIWSLTNQISGEVWEGSSNSMLIETVKKLNEAENTVKTLRETLCAKSEEDNFSWIGYQTEQFVENDLQCNICYEMFIKPTVLNCSHTFCHECIESWTRIDNHCPTCRAYVKNKSYCLTLDTFLDKMSECLPDDIKSRRESLKVERNNNRATETTSTNSRSQINNSSSNRNQSLRRTLDVLWDERDRDSAEWNIIVLEEDLFDPIRLEDILGRNRNDGEDNWEDDNFSDTSMESNDMYVYLFCTYCDNIGHTASDCPIFIMEEESDHR